MGRLTKYGETSHENGVCCTHFMGKECKEVGGECAYGCKWEEEAWSKLAHYEDLEEQGRLIETRARLGNKIYPVKRYIDEYRIIEISVNRYSIAYFAKSRDGDCIAIKEEDIGERYFFTKEEAEAKLKELEK